MGAIRTGGEIPPVAGGELRLFQGLGLGGTVLAHQASIKGGKEFLGCPVGRRPEGAQCAPCAGLQDHVRKPKGRRSLAPCRGPWAESSVGGSPLREGPLAPRTMETNGTLPVAIRKGLW